MHHEIITINDIVKKYFELEEVKTDDWKKPCVKAVSLLRQIKRLTASDTVDGLCECEEYIEFPKELTIKDFQENGAAYTYEPTQSDLMSNA